MRVGERVSNTANGPSERRVRNGAKAGHGAREAADSRRSERLSQAVGNCRRRFPRTVFVAGTRKWAALLP